MRTLDLERIIRAPRADVFDWLTDATNYQLVPSIRRVTPVRPGNVSEHGVGAVRLLVTPLLRLTEEIIDYDPPKLFRYRVLKSLPPLRRQDGTVTFDEHPEGTKVRWQSQFEVAAPLFAKAWTLALLPTVYLGLHYVLATADKELRRD
ncbi:SRPBCC family protein [Nocardia nova]|uniref:Polyketide cyclase/dehydrase and lipid transport-like protein n=1 Tax=Nocardia nova SH22a TaxID=1415166 RepID=W5TWQ4_9NOCA|nr:SRPBCC family protein [Nocardia nova]AHH21626.1 polyketide cyclase/dehydrase and lipid transport-like protein [Nocardia nova SH22a]